MKVLVLSKYSRIGASSRLRSLQYLPYLESNGVECNVASLFDGEYLRVLYQEGRRPKVQGVWLYIKRLLVLFGLFKYDLIYIEKEIFPYLPAFAERLLRLLGRPYVVDYDDAIFHNYDLSDSWIIRRFFSHKINAIMHNSACVIAGSAYLAARARAAGAPYVELVPTVVDHTRYIPRSSSSAERPVIGWIGSPSTQKYVLRIREALINVCQAHNARLMLVGATHQILAEFPGLDIDVLPWSEETEADVIRQMDIGIMPLSDGPWERGKCGYKLIQYMACAVPVIASPVGVNVDIVTGSQSGLLADTLGEWESALLQLLEAPDQRRKLGAAGRKAVEDTYSLQVQAPILCRIFEAVINKAKPGQALGSSDNIRLQS